jgi:hypothetical protein
MGDERAREPAGRGDDLDHAAAGDDPLVRPLDPADPRFTGSRSVPLPARRRELVATHGPGASPIDPRVRLLRGIIPALAIAGLLLIGAAFFRALAPGPSTVTLGAEPAVRAALAERPQRVCRETDGLPCAWLTEVDGRLLALSTSGPLPEELGRQGVGWCPSSGYFGSNAAGTLYDPAGNVVSGPAPRGLDRYAVRIREAVVVVDFGSRTAGRRAGSAPRVLPPAGAPCQRIPFMWDADLRLPAGDTLPTPGDG